MCLKLRHLKHSYCMKTEFQALEWICWKLLYVVGYFLMKSMLMLNLSIHAWCQYNFWQSNSIILQFYFCLNYADFCLICCCWLMFETMYTLLLGVLTMLVNIVDHFVCIPNWINQIRPSFWFKTNQIKTNTTNLFYWNMDRT